MTFLEYLVTTAVTDGKMLLHKFPKLFDRDFDEVHDLIMDAAVRKMRRDGAGWHSDLNVGHLRHELKHDRKDRQRKRKKRPNLDPIETFRCGVWEVEIELPAPDYSTERIDDLLSPLDSVTEHVVRETFLGGRSEQDVADELGISRDRVKRLKSKGKTTILLRVTKS